MRFSQRLGIQPVGKALQREGMDDELRNSLWSVVQVCFWNNFDGRRHGIYGPTTSPIQGSNLDSLITGLWLNFFKRPLDTIQGSFDDCVWSLRQWFFSAEWFEVYDFIEFISSDPSDGVKEEFVKLCNQVLERENSAYRFVDGRLTEITAEQEIESIEEAISSSDPFVGVREHLSSALALMSDRQNPNFRNSIKESVSAVESLCRHLVGDEKATLGKALVVLEKRKNLHPALKSAFSSLYGYTSDAGGIRHSLMDKDQLTKSDAKYMLVSCTAFINFAIALVSD